MHTATQMPSISETNKTNLISIKKKKKKQCNKQTEFFFYHENKGENSFVCSEITSITAHLHSLTQ